MREARGAVRQAHLPPHHPPGKRGRLSSSVLGGHQDTRNPDFLVVAAAAHAPASTVAPIAAAAAAASTAASAAAAAPASLPLLQLQLCTRVTGPPQCAGGPHQPAPCVVMCPSRGEREAPLGPRTHHLSANLIACCTHSSLAVVWVVVGAELCAQQIYDALLMRPHLPQPTKS